MKTSTNKSTIVRKFVRSSPNSLKVSLYRGDGRTRTAVQTLYPIAFYTLILPLVVGIGLPKDGRSFTLAFKS